MLKQLSIQNYALIEHTELELASGLSVITGETGAGKSIMLGALGMLLGQKTDTQVLLNKDKKCVVEATFDISAYSLQPLFDEADVDYASETTIRREILPSGKSRAFVNETPANVTFLKTLGTRLIDIHSQHQNMLLSQASFHLDVVDAVAATNAEAATYAEAYGRMRAKEQELEKLKEINARQSRELEYDRHILRELEAAKLDYPDELETLEKQQQAQGQIETIKENLAAAINALDTEDSGVLSQLRRVERNIDNVAQFLPTDAAVGMRLESARIELDDLCHTLQEFTEKIEFDADELARLTDRLNLLNTLTKKNSVASVGELIRLRDDLALKVSSVDNFDDRLKELTAELDATRADAQGKADVLTAKRQSVFASITASIEEQLHEMGMSNARFVVSHDKVGMRPDGQDEIRFLFAANKNGTPTDMARVASGGEMSRVMLSIKSLLSQTKNLPTIVFDEIDTGVSGDVADRMGRIMNDMSQHLQVLAITHLPQVAARGQRHYVVYKEDTDSKTVSHIKLLPPEERINELAKMLSGSHITPAALANAQELLNSSQLLTN